MIDVTLDEARHVADAVALIWDGDTDGVEKVRQGLVAILSRTRGEPPMAPAVLEALDNEEMARVQALQVATDIACRMKAHRVDEVIDLASIILAGRTTEDEYWLKKADAYAAELGAVQAKLADAEAALRSVSISAATARQQADPVPDVTPMATAPMATETIRVGL